MRRTAFLLLLSAGGSACAAGTFTAAVEPHRAVLQAEGRTYSVGDDGVIQPFGVRAQIVGNDPTGKGVWMALKRVDDLRLTRDDAMAKIVTGAWETTGGEPTYRLELELQIAAGAPGLTVRSRARRLSEGTSECYYYWGFGTTVTHYTQPGGPAQEFKATEWQVLPHSPWVYIANAKTGAGLGLITDGRIGRAPSSGEGAAAGEGGSSPYLICTPKTASLATGESLDVTFTVLAAKGAPEVAAACRSVRAASSGRVVFDGRMVAGNALRAPAVTKPWRTLRTSDGVAVAFSSDGRVADLAVAGKSLAPHEGAPLTGFFLRDHRAKSPFVPATDRVVPQGNGCLLTGTRMGVALRATCAPMPGRLDVTGELRDLTRTDRAVSLYFALPVRRDRPWRWGDSIEAERAVGPEDECLTSTGSPFPAGANGLNSIYPFACLSGPAQIAFGIPLDQPRLCRMTYNAETQQFFIAFDLALTEATARFPSRASFSFSVFTFEPNWGFRACAKRYYDLFPRFFEKRVKRDGGWVCWGNCADVPNVAELGYSYHWGLVSPEACKWDNDHGIYAFPYIEATNMHQTMEEFPAASSDDVLKRLRWIADPARKEPLPAWKYDHPYLGCLGDRDAALRKSAAGYLMSLIFDPQGHIYGAATKTEFDLLIAKYIPCDANPYLPGGSGEFFLDFWWPKVQAAMEAQGGRVDGMAMDNFHAGDTALGRRREQFAFETIPLTFETSTGAPVLIKNFTTYEWTNEAAKRLRPQGKYIIANTCSAQFPFTYQLLDVHGYEWNIQTMAPFARVMAYHKPVCSLPVQLPHKEDAWIRWHLGYGFLPGGYAGSETYLNRPAMAKYMPIIRKLQEAGWEPITDAVSDNPKVRIERFGRGGGGALLLTVHNVATDAQSARIRLDAKALGVSGSVTALDLTQESVNNVTNSSFSVKLGADDTRAFEVRCAIGR